MAKLNDLWKKGTGIPSAEALVEGGIAIDTTNKRLFSKSVSGEIFEIGGAGGTADAVNWTGVIGTPTTIAGYGITDSYTKSEVESKIVELAPAPDLSSYYDASEVDAIVATKVDKVTGKGLSTEDYTTAEKTKLAGIEAGAQVNTVTSVAGKTGVVTLVKGDVGLGSVDNTADSAKAVLSATKLATARTINGVSFDGTANITVADSTKVVANTDITAGTGTKITYDAKGLVTGSTTLSASDIPSLDASKITSGTIDAARLPSYVDDVIEGATTASFPTTGETGKIYVALDTNKTYRWSGSAYIYITSGAVDSVAGKTGVVTLTSSDVGLGNVSNTAQVTSVTASGALASSGGTTPAITHSTADGYLHVPATSTTNNGKFLQAGATAGSLSWISPNEVIGVTDLKDSVITSASSGQVLKFNGTSWVNDSISNINEDWGTIV